MALAAVSSEKVRQIWNPPPYQSKVRENIILPVLIHHHFYVLFPAKTATACTVCSVISSLQTMGQVALILLQYLFHP